MSERDVAIVLSGGGMNGVLLELGFLQRLQRSSLWPRIGRIYGTSAGALTGTMAALGMLDDLEKFVLDLQPADIFRPQSLWRLPLNGLHEYALPVTVGKRLLDPLEMGRRLTEAPIDVVIFATDVSDEDDSVCALSYELTYSSHKTPPDVLAQAVLASAAISALVLPLTVGDRIATDGGWVRNFPLGAALDDPEVNLVVAFRYVPRYPHIGFASLARLRRRLHRFRAVPPVRAFIAELDEAEARELRGEPVHLGDMLVRLMRVAIQRNTALEEQLADERDAAIRELDALRDDVTRIVTEHARPGRRDRAALAVGQRFARTALPRRVPRITVRGSGGAESLDAGFRTHGEWSQDAKRALIDRGYAAADAQLAAYGIDQLEQAG